MVHFSLANFIALLNNSNDITDRSSQYQTLQNWNFFYPIQDGGTKRPPLTSFSPNVGIRPQNFLTFSFNPFDRLV